MKIRRRLGAAVVALGLTYAMPASAQGVLNVYCSVQVEWCTLIANEFQKASGIKVSVTQKGSGETIAQLKAEAQNPKGDVWFGGTGDPHLQAAEENLTEPYKSPKMSELHPWAVKQNTDLGGKTVGIYAGALGFGFNTELLAKKGVKAPACWVDLLKPEFKGEIQMANPNSSGTAYVAIATLVQLMGEDKAFDYLKKMHANINAYTRSGTAPMKAVARGETMVSISFVHDGVTEALAGFPVKTATPCEGTGYEIGSMSIIKGARNMANAKKFYDWALTPEAQKLEAQAKQFQVPSNKATPLPPEAPKFADMKLIDYDQARYGKSAERKRLIAKWDTEVGALPKPSTMPRAPLAWARRGPGRGSGAALVRAAGRTRLGRLADRPVVVGGLCLRSRPDRRAGQMVAGAGAAGACRVRGGLAPACRARTARHTPAAGKRRGNCPVHGTGAWHRPARLDG